MASPFHHGQANELAPVYKWQSVTPSDDDLIGNIGHAFMVPSFENSTVTIEQEDGTDVTIPARGATPYPCAIKKVKATDTALPSGVTEVLVAHVYG